MTAGWLAELYESGEFLGKAFETAVLHRAAGLQASRVAVIGAGKLERFNFAGPGPARKEVPDDEPASTEVPFADADDLAAEVVDVAAG